jgi:hypothetical protein
MYWQRRLLANITEQTEGFILGKPDSNRASPAEQASETKNRQ